MSSLWYAVGRPVFYVGGPVSRRHTAPWFAFRASLRTPDGAATFRECTQTRSTQSDLLMVPIALPLAQSKMPVATELCANVHVINRHPY